MNRINLSHLEDLYTDFENYADGIREYNPAIRCSAGCSKCCEVNGSPPVSEMEWELLRQHLEKKEKSFLIFIGNNLQDEIEKIRKDLKNHERIKPEIRCTFLDQTGKCTVYQFRPLVCRLFGFTKASAQMMAYPEEYIYTCNMELERWKKSPLPLMDNKQLYLDKLKAINLEINERQTLPLIKRLADYLLSKGFEIKNTGLLDFIRFRY